MNAERRQTHVWEVIARHAFRPRDDTERARWLNCFFQAFPSYVADPILRSPTKSGMKIAGAFGCQCLDFECVYSIESERADFTMLVPSCELQCGIESTVFACLPCLHECEEARDELQQDDVSSVLRGMVEHPRAHLHIHQDKFPHNIRIGTGLSDPFLFLFQLRFQLCVDSARREEELERLIQVFTLQVLKRENDVSPQTLFGLGG